MRYVLAIISLLYVMTTSSVQAQSDLLFVGTYSQRGSEGIYVFRFDRRTGGLQPLQTASNDKSPSFLAIHPSGKFLYSVNEGADKAGGVSAYAIDATTGRLTHLNNESSLGAGPCHISLDQTGRLAFVSNYGGGTFTVLSVEADGRLGAPLHSFSFTGNGPNRDRQEKPHIHSATVSPDNRFVYVADLGTDRLYVYAINPASGSVMPAATPSVAVKPGSGPRHFTFHPNGKFAYLVEELTSSVATFARDEQTGTLTPLQESVATLPGGFTEKNTSADIHTDPTGAFLYQSNRGLNALSILTIAPDGRVTLAGYQPTEGKTPRNFLVDAHSDYVLVANQESDSIVVFKRDRASGKLSPTGQSVNVPAPVCLKLHTQR